MTDVIKPPLLETLPEADVISITKIIISLSAKFATKFPYLTIDDCIQESYKKFATYQDRCDTTKSKVTTWVYKMVKDTLISYAKKEFYKTQKWDDIDKHSFELVDNSVSVPHQNIVYSDFVSSMGGVLSPYSFRLLKLMEINPKANVSFMSKSLGVSERDLNYIRREIKTATQHLVNS